ncbi:MAG: MFS transporter [Fibrobacteria bacterium]|nr:MFS transporter [Fibrobacteria bacterium]
MQTSLKIKLSTFNFIQYMVWGSWYVSMGAYMAVTLKFEGQQIGYAYGAFAIGSMISPFFTGLIADRFFSSEKMLGVLGILGGVVLCLMPQFTTFASFYPMLILYCALYVPTLALGNSLALHHLQDSQKDFPRIKIWAAVGWIAGGVILSMLKGEQSVIQWYLAGTISVCLGLFSFTLPNTPPKKGANASISELLGLDALALLKQRSFAIFIICMFLICIPLYFYFVMMGIYLTEIGWTGIAGKLTLAQVSDVIFLFSLPFFLKKLGYKKTIFFGILAWMLRYYFLAGSVTMMPSVLIFTAILLHGVCYDFLFTAGQLYVDSQANEKIRGASQGFLAFILWGIGSFVGTMLAGKVLARYTDAATALHDWQSIWLVPAVLATGVMVVFLIFFKEPKKKEEPANAEN